MVNVLDTAQIIAEDFSALGDWIGVCTGVPGNSETVNNEATGGNPAYARQTTDWTQHTNGSVTGSVVSLNLPPGTYPYMIMCSQSTGNNMMDWCILPTPIIVTEQRTVKVTPNITAS